MKPNCKTRIKWTKIECKLSRENLTALTTITSLRKEGRLIKVELKDMSSVCKFNIDLVVSCIFPQEDGSVQIFGGAGSDEHYGTWCFIIPSEFYTTDDKTIETFAYHVSGIPQLSFRIQC